MERRRGRRDNGLEAADFAAVGDLDPRLAEHLLDLLGARGIAAYLQPSMDINPITRNSTVPSRPTDRLYADRAHLGTARHYLRQLLAEEDSTDLTVEQPLGTPGEGSEGADAPGDREPGDRESDELTFGGPSQPSSGGHGTRPASGQQPLDATFEGIVASFNRPVDPTAAPWPAAENLPSTRRDAAPDQAPDQTPEQAHGQAPGQVPAGRRGDHPASDEPTLLDGLDTFGAHLPDSEPPEESFVPPPPPPLPRLSRQTVLGALAIMVGLTLVIAPGLSPFGRGDAILLGFAAIVGGAVALILRLRPGTDPGEEQHPDDGARV